MGTTRFHFYDDKKTLQALKQIDSAGANLKISKIYIARPKLHPTDHEDLFLRGNYYDLNQ
jgi:hypothetical protein